MRIAPLSFLTRSLSSLGHLENDLHYFLFHTDAWNIHFGPATNFGLTTASWRSAFLPWYNLIHTTNARFIPGGENYLMMQYVQPPPFLSHIKHYGHVTASKISRAHRLMS